MGFFDSIDRLLSFDPAKHRKPARAKGGKLRFHRVRTVGDAFHASIRATADKSGVYVIRERGGRVLYVGESHTGRLYDTLTRHFHKWRVTKGSAKYYDHKPGRTYDASACEVAVLVTPSARALPTQNRLIDELDPRDNERPL